MIKTFLFTLLLASSVSANISTTLNLRSNYIYSGVGFSNDESMIDGSFDYSHENGFFGGIWTGSYSNTTEIDTYVGYSFNVKKLGFILSYNRWNFLTSSNSNTNEFSAEMAYLYFKLTAKHFDNWAQTGNKKSSVNFLRLSFERQIEFQKIFVLGHIGSSFVKNKNIVGHSDWVDWLIGIKRNIEGFNLVMQYTGTNRKNLVKEKLRDERISFEVSKTF